MPTPTGGDLVDEATPATIESRLSTPSWPAIRRCSTRRSQATPSAAGTRTRRSRESVPLTLLRADATLEPAFLPTDEARFLRAAPSTRIVEIGGAPHGIHALKAATDRYLSELGSLLDVPLQAEPVARWRTAGDEYRKEHDRRRRSLLVRARPRRGPMSVRRGRGRSPTANGRRCSRSRSRSTSSTPSPTKPRAGPERAGTAGRHRQEHCAPHVFGPGRAWAVAAHACRHVPARLALRRVRPAGDRPLRGR